MIPGNSFAYWAAKKFGLSNYEVEAFVEGFDGEAGRGSYYAKQHTAWQAGHDLAKELGVVHK